MQRRRAGEGQGIVWYRSIASRGAGETRAAQFAAHGLTACAASRMRPARSRCPALHRLCCAPAAAPPSAAAAGSPSASLSSALSGPPGLCLNAAGCAGNMMSQPTPPRPPKAPEKSAKNRELPPAEEPVSSW
jgi:hypothetical protein